MERLNSYHHKETDAGKQNENGQLGVCKNPGADQFSKREEAFLYAHVFLRKTYKGVCASMLGIIL